MVYLYFCDKRGQTTIGQLMFKLQITSPLKTFNLKFIQFCDVVKVAIIHKNMVARLKLKGIDKGCTSGGACGLIRYKMQNLISP